MLPQDENFTAQIQNDTFVGVSYTVTDNDTETAIDLTSYGIKLQIRDTSKAGRVLKDFTEANGINISDPENGIFEIEPFLLDMPTGIHKYDIQFTDGDGIISTWIEGNFPIKREVTS